MSNGRRGPHIRVPTYLGVQAGPQSTGFSRWLLGSGRDLKVWKQWVENKCCEHSWQVSLGQVGHWEPKVAGC